MDGKLVSDHLLAFIKSKRTFKRLDGSFGPREDSDVVLQLPPSTTYTTAPSFSSTVVSQVSSECELTVNLSNPTFESICCCPKSQHSLTWTYSNQITGCKCYCARCQLNQQLPTIYGITLVCYFHLPTFDDDFMLFNRTMMMNCDTGLLLIERYLLECYEIYGYIPLEAKELKTYQFRHYVVERRSYLQDLEVFAPVVDQFGSITCSTCNRDVYGTASSCQCRKFSLSETLDWSDDALKIEFLIHLTPLDDDDEFFELALKYVQFRSNCVKCTKLFNLAYAVYHFIRPPCSLASIKRNGMYYTFTCFDIYAVCPIILVTILFTGLELYDDDKA